eukprot:12597875-Ditylum_brightwellii.AAC.2
MIRLTMKAATKTMRLMMRKKTMLTLVIELLWLCFGLHISMTDNLVRKRAQTLCNLFSKYVIDDKDDEADNKDNKADDEDEDKDKNKDDADVDDRVAQSME